MVKLHGRLGYVLAFRFCQRFANRVDQKLGNKVLSALRFQHAHNQRHVHGSNAQRHINRIPAHDLLSQFAGDLRATVHIVGHFEEDQLVRVLATSLGEPLLDLHKTVEVSVSKVAFQVTLGETFLDCDARF